MKCEKCVEAGLKSIITAPMGGFSTLMGWSPYYDEEGRYHSHDPNRRTEEYSCSNGHRWTLTRKSECSNCDYGKEEEINYIDRD